MLAASAIDPTVRSERGYETVTKRADLLRLGFTERQARVPALVIPLFGVVGEAVGYQLRPDVPRVGRDGKTVKYETPGKSRMVMDVPPRARPWLSDPQRPLFVTEGIKKADAAVSKGLCCLALLGVWNFRGTNELGGKTALAEWESITLEGRQVYVVFDSDVATKPAVRAALLRLRAFLEHRKAKVAVIYLPCGEGGTKVGLDDFFAAGHGVDDLLRCAEADVRSSDLAAEKPSSPYVFEKDGIYLLVETRDGTARVRLTNFVARIACETTLDDGLETHKVFRVVADLAGRQSEFDVAAGEFEEMRWPAAQIGAGATLLPVANVDRHVRAAIQTTSGVTAERRRVYVHTGWIQHQGRHIFLHAGGALGRDGVVADVEVRLDPRLQGFTLPAPAPMAEVALAVRDLLRLLGLGPRRIMVPLLAALFRVVIAACDFSIHLTGGTGVFKTAVAALVQQVFGAALNARNLPGSWASTGNSLETLAFYAKDVVLVVDDFAPAGGVPASGRLHEKAERVFRAQGNRAGRSRCGPDGSLLVTRAPRGLVLSTGEDTPRGASLRARFLTLEVGPGDIDREKLTVAQAAAAAGRFALVMTTFVVALAPRLDEVRARLAPRIETLRVAFSREGRHRRVPAVAADLLFGMEVFVECFVALGVLTREEGEAILKDAFEALGEAVTAQDREQREAEPGARFVTLLRSALTSGAAHLTDAGGLMPPNAATWGWQVVGVERPAEGDKARWMPQGLHAGWIDGEDVYLDTEAALQAAQRVGSGTGDPLSILATTLGKRLKDSGLLASTDPDGRHIEVQRRLAGARRRVLHFSAETVMPTGEEPPAGSSTDTSELRPNPPNTTGSAWPRPARMEDPVPGPGGATEDLSPAPAPLEVGPDSPCRGCGGNQVWVAVGGAPICRRCHPPAPGAEATL